MNGRFVLDNRPNYKQEISRLVRLNNFYHPITKGLFGQIKANHKLDIKSIIDIGGGTGHTTALLKKIFPDAKVTYFDISTHLMNYAKLHFNEIDYFIQADIFDCHFTKKYDFVFSRYVLKHLFNPRKAVKIMSNILNKNGFLCLIDKDVSSNIWYPGFPLYKTKFMNALNPDLTTQKQGIAYLWGLIGIILGFDQNIDKAYDKLIEYSNDALTKKGPRIDYKMEEKNLNPLWAIRTAMSFKLAGVDNYLISFGVIESFAEFLNTIYETLNKEMELGGAILVGDMFEGEFLNKTYTNISKNYPIFIPKSLPMSGAIEAYGSAVINSKV